MRLTAFLPSRLPSHLPSRLPRRASAQLPALALLLVAVLLLVALLVAALLPRPAAASDMPSYDLTLDNGKLIPEVLEVKAGEKIRHPAAQRGQYAGRIREQLTAQGEGAGTGREVVRRHPSAARGQL